MIVTVTPNPALDVTYRVPGLVPGESHRVGSPARRAGGKGVNTASVLSQLGVPAVAVAAVSEEIGRWWAADLRFREIRSREVVTDGNFRTRSSIALVDDAGAATLLNEAGMDPGDRVWAELTGVVLEELSERPSVLAEPPAALSERPSVLAEPPSALSERPSVLAEPPAAPPAPARPGGSAPSSSVLAVCGSLPVGVHVDPLLALVAEAQGAGAAVVVDGSGPWLFAVLTLRPAVVRCNQAEAEVTTGLADPADAARALVEAGAAIALVSLGADGVILVGGDGLVHRARPRESLQGNPTGAGDAATAAVCAHLARHRIPEPEPLLRDVVGWSGAAVLRPLAGDVEVDQVGPLSAAAVYAPPTTQEAPCR